jgi:hypothetical protein
VNSASRNTAPAKRSTRSASERASIPGIIGNSGVSRKNAGLLINTAPRSAPILQLANRSGWTWMNDRSGYNRQLTDYKENEA